MKPNHPSISRLSMPQSGITALLIATFAVFLFSGCEEAPQACFSVENTVVDQNEDVLFTNCSQFQQEGYEWDFGDGGTSKVVSPVHRFTSRGEYLVVLKSKGKNSSQDDTHSEIIKVGARILQRININSLPADNNGTPWDANDDPDVALLFYKNNTLQFTSTENTNLGMATPYVLDESAAGVDLTPDTWTFIVADMDSIDFDTMGVYTVNLNLFEPDGVREIADESADVDFVLEYDLQ